MNFSFATTPGSFQGSIEAELDKQGGKSYGPPTGKRMTIFLDDLSMPEVNTWGDQPTLELARQLVETGGVCFLDKDKRGDVKEVRGVDYVAAMDLPGGGKNDIPNRLKRHFFMLTVVTPSPSSVAAIYGILLQSRFDAKEFKYLGGEFPGFVARMPPTTMALFKWLREKMLPSPTKFHYTFTLKDLSRLFQGILRTPKSTYTQDNVLVQLWRHEAERVFSDKLVNLQDKDKFKKELDLVSKQLTGAAPQKSGKGKDRPPSALKSPTKRGKSVSRPGSAPAADIHSRCVAPALFVDFLRDDEYDEDGILARSRRFEVWRRLHAVDATRVHLTSMRVVSFSNLGPIRDAPRRSPKRRRFTKWAATSIRYVLDRSTFSTSTTRSIQLDK